MFSRLSLTFTCPKVNENFIVELLRIGFLTSCIMFFQRNSIPYVDVLMFIIQLMKNDCLFILIILSNNLFDKLQQRVLNQISQFLDPFHVWMM